MNNILSELIGHEVVVFSGESSGFSDAGVVKNVDERVLLLESGEKLLVFPLNSIRVIRIVA